MKWLFVILALFCAAPALAQTATPTPASTPVPATAMTPSPDDRARQWLTLVDDGNYADSYRQMGAAATARISADAWAEKEKTARTPLGAMSSRNLKDVKISGQTAVVRYDSAFAHKAAVLETVSLSSGKDGWSVVGYVIN